MADLTSDFLGGEPQASTLRGDAEIELMLSRGKPVVDVHCLWIECHSLCQFTAGSFKDPDISVTKLHRNGGSSAGAAGVGLKFN
jgi:hypothetical protein